eukprot:CAMPEP_0202692016 /NCGR_PEP_ID=MMETSP1385-20130828/6523_1 /ASSEMBLY_ACC=CAM_ASM_000861 /TAXON_ID=933848 /ORGANISM="Elphidium margaritaceum" /LENGTH=508 /DNA_ID=CAMNT_0049347485 /DNA_START=18 /DNA_END=1544 /DNA_ORIENTATION=-
MAEQSITQDADPQAIESAPIEETSQATTRLKVNKRPKDDVSDDESEAEQKTEAVNHDNHTANDDDAKSSTMPAPQQQQYPISVFVRIRPLVGDEKENGHESVEYSVSNATQKKSKSKAQTKGKNNKSNGKPNTQNLTLVKCAGRSGTEDKKYINFKSIVLPTHNNEYTFAQVILPSIDNLFVGCDTCAFAYGHTGSGKTHTIFGYDAEHGMYGLFAQELVRRVQALQNDTLIEIRFTELYQDTVRDLLTKDKVECFLREDDKGNVHVRGPTVKYEKDGRVLVKMVTAVHVTETEEIYKHITEGVQSRNVGKSTLHDKSSRSHAFLEFELVNRELVDARAELPEQESILDVQKRKYDLVKKGVAGNKSKLPELEAKVKKLKARIKDLKQIIKKVTNDEHKPYIGSSFVFVDLAGNEFGKDVNMLSNDKQQEEERRKINLSLLALKECIRGLHNKKIRVPYRDSKLTMYLRKYLKGQGSKAIMISNIGPSKHLTKATINTLKYATLIANA